MQLEPGMRDAAFGKWLLKIGRLDVAQRGRVLRALALAEAGALIVCLPGDDVPPDEAADQDAPMPPMVAQVSVVHGSVGWC